MILTEADITEYQGLIRKRFGLEVSRDEALEDALSLIQFVKNTQKHIPETLINQFKKEEEMMTKK